MSVLPGSAFVSGWVVVAVQDMLNCRCFFEGFGVMCCVSVHSSVWKDATFPVFGAKQPEFGTFVCKIRVCMPWVEIVEIWGISGVFLSFWGSVCLCGRRGVCPVAGFLLPGRTEVEKFGKVIS